MLNTQLKIRIANGNATAIGPGKAELLALIDKHGSISAAAKQMRMSYRRAWELVDVMNKCFIEPVVHSSAGGAHGGGAQLTEFGTTILKAYNDMVEKSQLAAQQELAQISAALK
jgi:molybdate transport system regulatory protein